MKKTTTKMMSGGKATAKPKMAKGGAAPKKKYAMAGTTNNGDGPLDGGKNCKNGKCAPGTRVVKMGLGQKIKNAFSPGRIKTSRVK